MFKQKHGWFCFWGKNVIHFSLPLWIYIVQQHIHFFLCWQEIQAKLIDIHCILFPMMKTQHQFNLLFLKCIDLFAELGVSYFPYHTIQFQWLPLNLPNAWDPQSPGTDTNKEGGTSPELQYMCVSLWERIALVSVYSFGNFNMLKQSLFHFRLVRFATILYRLCKDVYITGTATDPALFARKRGWRWCQSRYDWKIHQSYLFFIVLSNLLDLHLCKLQSLVSYCLLMPFLL